MNSCETNKLTISKLKMLTQADIAEILNCNKDNVTMLREVGVLRAIKTGRSYMYSQRELERFMEEYVGLDVSNRENAIRSLAYVESQKELKGIQEAI